jgi:hypothetical protein
LISEVEKLLTTFIIKPRPGRERPVVRRTAARWQVMLRRAGRQGGTFGRPGYKAHLFESDMPHLIDTLSNCSQRWQPAVFTLKIEHSHNSTRVAVSQHCLNSWIMFIV